MSAKLMANALSQLMARHGVELQAPQAVPLVPHTASPMVLSGYASTCGGVDGERISFAPYAFGTTLPNDCRLLFNHDANQPAGTVYALTYDHAGNLMCRALVTHPQARRCNAFSVGARVKAFKICNAESPHFYALVQQAELTDISLVEAPCNPKALVTSREPEDPNSKFYSLMIQRTAVIQQMANVLVTEVVKQHGAVR